MDWARLLPMRMPALERRAQETASALAFLVALTSPQAARQIVSAATSRQISRGCRRTVTVLGKLANDMAGTSGDEKPLAAKEHLGLLEASLLKEDYVTVERQARRALRALGVRTAPKAKGPAKR